MYALCAPKINITLDGSCRLTLSNVGYSNPQQLFPGGQDCWWQTEVPLSGSKLNPKAALSKVSEALLVAVGGRHMAAVSGTSVIV